MSLERNLSIERRYFDSLIKKIIFHFYFRNSGFTKETNRYFWKGFHINSRMILAENDSKVLVHIS